MTVSPTDTSMLYAGAFGWGVFKSSDAGATWLNKRSGLTNAYVRSVEAVSTTTVFCGTNDGVYKTTDGGTTWVLSLQTPFSVRSICFDAGTGSTYAGSFGAGLYKSTNLGTSWSAIPVTDPVAGQTIVHIWSVVAFGRDSLYVGGSIPDVTSGGALFRSLDGGASWIQVQRATHIGSSVRSIAISPSNPDISLILGTAAKGVYRSTNGGLTWSNISDTGVANTLPDFKINAVAFGTSYRYAGTDSLGGCYVRSANDGTTGWTAGQGLPGAMATVNAIAINRLNRSTLFLATEGEGMMRSTDAGFHWTPRNFGMMGTAIRDIRRNGDGTLVAGADFGDGIWLSTNQGTNWTQALTLTTSNAITSISPTNSPSVLYAAAYGTGVYKSVDGGWNWDVTDTSVINHFVRAVEADPTNANIVYAGTGNGVYKSVDGGLSWSASNTGIPPSTSIRSMAIDRTTPANLYVSTDSLYMYRSSDAGASWTHVTSADGFLPQDIFIRTITIDYLSAGTLYAGADSGRIYRSTNHGASWSLSSKLAATHSVRSILIHPNDHSRFFAATFGDGIFESADTGLHWLGMNLGLTDVDYYALESDNANPLNLYAGSSDLGVFRTSYVATSHRPVLSPIGSKSVLAGQVLAFTVSASDSDATIPALSASGAPSGAVFVDSLDGNGLFSWSTGLGDIGLHGVTIHASDGVLADSQFVSIQVLDPSTSTVISTPVSPGWNLLSVPVLTTETRKSIVFPGASSQAFAYAGSYAIRDTVTEGNGYWLKYQTAGNQSFGGGTIACETVAVRANWNLIGSLSQEISVVALHPAAPISLLSNVFGYNAVGGYSVADSIRPGRGYWVKVNQAGNLVIGPAVAVTPSTREKASIPSTQEMQDDATITFTSPSGELRALHFLHAGDPTRAATIPELPPRSPAGSVDVRFHDSNTDQFMLGGPSASIPVDLSSPGELLMHWSISNEFLSFEAEVPSNPGMRRLHLIGSGSAVVRPEESGSRAEFHPATGGEGSKEAPLRCALFCNYPNPFNPSTVISYELAVQSHVTLGIYDVLGRIIVELVDRDESPGEHAVRWIAENVSSGVYIYRFTVVDPSTGREVHREAKKMFLLR